MGNQLCQKCAQLACQQQNYLLLSSRTPSNLWEKVMGSFNSTTPCSVSFQLRVTTAPSNWEKDNKIRPMAPTVFPYSVMEPLPLFGVILGYIQPLIETQSLFKTVALAL